MKSHFCRVEGTTVEFEGECNWCGAKEVVLPRLTDEIIAELWHKSDRHLYKFAKMLRDWLEEHGTNEETLSVMDRGCYERGCACYDDRVDKDGVVVSMVEVSGNKHGSR